MNNNETSEHPFQVFPSHKHNTKNTDKTNLDFTHPLLLRTDKSSVQPLKKRGRRPKKAEDKKNYYKPRKKIEKKANQTTQLGCMDKKSLIPPKNGKRKRQVKIIPPFNHKNPFQLVHILNTDKYGIRAYNHDSFRNTQKHPTKCHVYVEYDTHPTLFAEDQVENTNLPLPPKYAYHVENAIIGGIGKTQRWTKIMPPIPHFHEKIDLRVSRITDKNAFRALTVTLFPFAMSDFKYEPYDDNEQKEKNVPVYQCVISASSGKHIGIVCGYYHKENYQIHFLQEYTNNRAGKLGIERYDRSGHMWWNQPKEKAGPLRDTHRWRFSYIPSTWKTPPFTWEAIAENIATDMVDNDITHLPLPLRYYVEYAHCLKMEKELPPIEKVTGNVTSRLLPEQTKQILCAAYWTLIAPIDISSVQLARLIQFRYLLHGYSGREIGDYRQNALHLGHGAYIRKFKNKKQYEVNQLSTAVLNKIAQPNGEMRGSGFKGTRGKYGHANYPKYNAKRHMKRDVVEDMKILNCTGNIITEYREGKKETLHVQSF